MSYVTLSIRKTPALLKTWSMYQVEIDITFAKHLEIVLTRLEAGLKVEVGQESE